MEKYKSAFISYNKEVSEKARQISNRLKNINTFIFERDMDVQRNIKDIIERIDLEIQNRDVFIVVLSKKGIESEWIYTEIDLALRYKKPIFGFKSSANLVIPDHLNNNEITIFSKLDELEVYFDINQDPDMLTNFEVRTLIINKDIVHISKWLPEPDMEIPEEPHVALHTKCNIDGDMTNFIDSELNDPEIIRAHHSAVHTAHLNMIAKFKSLTSKLKASEILSE